jgi:hypothetical protein
MVFINIYIYTYTVYTKPDQIQPITLYLDVFWFVWKWGIPEIARARNDKNGAVICLRWKNTISAVERWYTIEWTNTAMKTIEMHLFKTHVFIFFHMFNSNYYNSSVAQLAMINLLSLLFHGDVRTKGIWDPKIGRPTVSCWIPTWELLANFILGAKFSILVG